ncbi:catecholate siderophore receptor CirA [Thalassotalea insulae]|uniref:Catecholate siderophore receptor CirA n=1 Tax=Thalassotalea insulae TaxID=2056778 RepID=A0ABQ6GUD7_9GAMM|nr:TonB-dependent receptor [Thalassotalea insulae]GLX78949.1 catecholate siderophore receptor CirA [Thalassotalea insulae]
MSRIPKYLPALLVVTCNSGANSLDDIFSLSLKQLMQTPVSIATVSETTALTAPASISFLTRSDIENLGVKSLVELMNHIPGFYASYNSIEGNDSYMVSRGHAQKYANTILFLLNGQRINEDYTGGINYLIRAFKLSQVERVEVIRGPGSALYGANAFNGVINIITKIQPELTVSAGTLNSRQASIAWQYTVNDWELGFSFDKERQDGETYRMIFDRFAIEQQTSDPHKSSQAMFAVNYRNFKWLTLYKNYQFEQFYLFRRVNNQANQLQQNNLIHQLSYTLNLTDDKQLAFSGQWHQGHRRSVAMLQPQNDDIFAAAPLLFGEHFSYDNKQAGVDFIYPINEMFELSSGIDWSLSKLPNAAIKSNYNLYGDLEYLDDITVFGESNQRIVLDTRRKTLSGYLQLQTHWSTKLSLTAGLRLDTYNDIANRTNPRVALVYQADNHHIFKLAYNEAYRVPSLGDLYDEESGLVDGNQTLKPTVLKSAEVNYQYISNDFFFSSTLFENHISDLIGFDTSNDITQLANISSNQTSGLENEWRWTINPQWQLHGHFSYIFRNHSKVDATAMLLPSELLAPKSYGLLGVNWQISDKWQNNIQLHWRSRIDTLTDKHSLTLLNLHSRYLLNDKNTLTLTVKNLLDKDYQHATITTIGEIDDQPLRQLPARGQQITVEYQHSF